MGDIATIKIEEVKTIKDLKIFIDFHYELYKKNKYFVPPLRFDEMNTLRWDKNPAFEHCESKYWIAVRNNEVVGRIAGIINKKYMEIWKNKYARFGWFDFIDDIEVSGALLTAFENWAKEKGSTAVHGPLGFTDLDREGMLIEGFDKLGTVASIYNHSYYPAHIDKLGYKKDADWVEYNVKVPSKIPEKVERISKIVLKKHNLRIVEFKKSKDVLKYAKGIFELINLSYKDLYGVVELTEKQIDTYIKQYLGFVHPDFITVIVDKNDKVVAFEIAMPSLSVALQKAKGRLFPFGFIHLLYALKKPKYIDMYLVAVHPSLQNTGVSALIMLQLTKAAIKNKIISCETNPELETNAKVQSIWEYYEARQHKRRRCYIKLL